MQKQPAVRASALRDIIALMDRVERGAQARLYARLPEPCKTLVESTARTGWIPVEHGHHTVDGIVEIFGSERAVTFWSDAISDMAERPIFKAFLSGMLKVGVLDPTRVLGVFATGWSLAYRDVCLPRVSTNGEGRPVLRFDEVAPDAAPPQLFPLVARKLRGLHALRGDPGLGRLSGRARRKLRRGCVQTAVARLPLPLARGRGPFWQARTPYWPR